MLRDVTTTCHNFDRPEIAAFVEHDEWFSEELRDLIVRTAESVALGVKFEPGYDLSIGWMALNMVLDPNGNLVIEEPDFQSMPIQWVRRLDRCFEHIRVQVKLMESIGLDDQFSFSSLGNAGVIGRDCYEPGPLRLCREEPEQARDSGWVFEPIPPKLDYNVDPAATLVYQSLYQTALVRPEIVPFMAMPFGSDVRIAVDGELTMYLNDRKLNLSKGSNIRDYLPRDLDTR